MKFRNGERSGSRRSSRALRCLFMSGLLAMGLLAQNCANPGADLNEAFLPGSGDALNRLLLSGRQLLNLGDTGQLRYNQVQQKSSHNSFSRDEGLLDQLVFHRIRSIEFDIYRGKLGRPGISDDWYVYHTPVIDTGTSCDKLSHCLKELQVFDRMHPDHDVVTVWFDIKDGWSGGQNPNSFDSLVKQYIDESDIVKPSDLIAACPGASNIRSAVTGTCGWPTLNAMKGKWLFVVTEGSYGNRANALGYSSATANNNADVDNSSRIFFNQGDSNNGLATYIFNQGFVSRRYVVDDQNSFNAAIAGRVHHIATNKINYRKDSWAKTHNILGWPFRCLVNCATPASNENIIGIEVNSEDIWGRDDHFVFLHQGRGTAGGRWIASVATASSHVDRWAKGCLMARQHMSTGSPYFAVCRPADNSKIRIQWRDNQGANSGARDVNINYADGLDQPNLTYMKMDVYNDGKCAAGFASQDGVRWTSIGSRCFSQPLYRQGLAGSSHGNANVKHLFSNVSYWGALQELSDFGVQKIGTVRFAQPTQGPFETPTAVNRYDLGTSNSPVFSGYTRVSAGTAFGGRAYGWTNTAGNSERDRGPGSTRNDLNRDLVFNSQPRTFEQIVPNGKWYALITFGDVYLHDNQTVDVEGVRQLSNITTQPNEYRNEFVAAEVTDGKFSLRFSDEGGSDPNWTITRLIIQNTPHGGQAPLP